METNLEKLLKKCNGKIECNRFNLFIWSFMNDFKELQNISFGGIDDYELKQFVKICDNRLDRAKIFIKDIAVVLGFDFVALSIIATATEDSIFRLLFKYPIYYIFIIFVFAVLIFLFSLLVHYRSQIHAWTAFKEIALMKCTGKVEKPKETA